MERSRKIRAGSGSAPIFRTTTTMKLVFFRTATAMKRRLGDRHQGNQATRQEAESRFRRPVFERRTSNFVLLRRFSLQSSVFSLLLCLATSCTAISIAPSCPNELRIGESAPLLANELTPGAIATYSWVVDPPFVGTVRDPESPNTVFQATAEGNARIELTANDGLFQVTSFCTTRVAGVANTNANENDNGNANTNTNDNRPDIPDRPGGVRKVRP